MKEARRAVEFARKLRSEGDDKLAQDAFRKAMVEVFCGQAEVYLSEGDKESADQILGEAEKMDPEARKNFEIEEEFFIERGRIWLQEKQYTGARSEFQAALTLNEKNVPALFGMGEVFYGLNEPDEGKEIFERLMKTKGGPNDPEMYKQIGKTACHGMHFDLAHKALNRAAKIIPSDSEVFYCKAVALVEEGHFEAAIPHLDKALQLNQGFAAARALDHKVRNWLKGTGAPAAQAQTPFDIDPRPRRQALLTPAGVPMRY